MELLLVLLVLLLVTKAGADIAVRAGLFQHPAPTPPVLEYMFSAVVIMAIVTTLISPLMLRNLVARDKPGS